MTSIILSEASYCILAALSRPLHGYGIAKKVEILSQGRVLLGAGTLYGALTALQKKGWIEAAGDDGRRKLYALTDRGRAMIATEVARYEQLAGLGRILLSEEGQKNAAE